MRRARLRGLSAAGFHRLAYREWGDPDCTDVVVCVHGLTRNGSDFAPLAEALADRFRVVSPDIVGRGESDWLRDPKGYVYPQYLSDMNALIARTGASRVHWVGTSMGGFMGMLMAALPATPIERLVLNDIGPFIPKDSLERIAGYVGDDPRFPDRSALDAYLREIYAPFGPFTAAQWAALVDSSVRGTPDGDVALAYDPAIAVPLRSAPIADVDVWSVWDSISSPVLLIRGETSDVLPADTAHAMTQRGPCARLEEIAGIGHAPSLMSAPQIETIVAFLAET